MIRGRLRPGFSEMQSTPAAATYRPPRRMTRRIGRFVYLVLVLGFAFYLLTTLVGNLLVLNADGLVTSDRFVVGAAYTARVEETHVAPGDTVSAGDVIARLESTDVLSTIAQLSQNAALMEARRNAMAKRRTVVKALIPVARRRLKAAKDGEGRLSHDPGGDVTSQAYRSSVLIEAFEAERELVTLESEALSVEAELASLDASLSEVQSAINKTQQSYADGIVAAPVDGTVGATVASPGRVLTAGEPVMELLTGSQYVLAYLPSGRLYEVFPGDLVVLTDGVRTLDARVERLDAVADNLPDDFRTTFGAHERQQVMRVVSQDALPFPYLTRVSVVAPWSLTHFTSWIKGVAANLSSREGNAS
jgi:multidrug resistance efflux pump